MESQGVIYTCGLDGSNAKMLVGRATWFNIFNDKLYYRYTDSHQEDSTRFEPFYQMDIEDISASAGAPGTGVQLFDPKQLETVGKAPQPKTLAAPSKPITDSYQNDMGRLSLSGGAFEGNRLSIADRGDYYEISEISLYRDFYLEADQVSRLKAGDMLTVAGNTYQIEAISKASSPSTPFPYYNVSMEENTNMPIYQLWPTADGKHYTAGSDNDITIDETVYTGSIWIRRDAQITGLDPLRSDEIITVPAEDYLERMISAGQDYLYIRSFEVDENGWITSMRFPLAG